MRVLKKIPLMVGFLFFYLWKLVTANIHIAYEIVTPRSRLRSKFITVPVELRTNYGVLLFSNLLSMTPGTLTVEIGKDHRSILIHALSDQDEERLRLDIMKLQDRVKHITE